MNFEQKMQQYIQVDNKLKELYSQMVEMRETKAQISKSLTSYAETHDMTHKPIQIKDEKLRFVTTRVATPLSCKYVEKCLGELIPNEAQVKKIIDHIKTKREIKSIQEIKRYPHT